MFFCFQVVFGTAQTPVPVAKEPDHHLKLENSWIRVYDVVVPPGDQTLMHVHGQDYFFVNFGEAMLKNQAAGRPEQDLDLKDGEVRYTPAVLTHRIRNVGRTPFHNLTVELLRPAAGKNPSPPLGKNETLVLDNARIRAVQSLLKPGETTGIHSHPQHTLIVMVDGGTIRIELPGEASKPRQIKPGEFIWHDSPVTHSLANTGNAAVRIIEVEVK